MTYEWTAKYIPKVRLNSPIQNHIPKLMKKKIESGGAEFIQFSDYDLKRKINP